MTTLSTHVLDAVRGVPAAGIAVTLLDPTGTEAVVARTDADGRITGFGADLAPATYRLRFDTGAYFADQGLETFYPEVTITFTVTDTPHLHVPLLLSPFAYSTYRGS
ncbi:hydroxyisourate hydrolase [Nocardia terpenica]|uniref:5-hydroxyisourate hydrolase n=1 Tax=Nocardia terpenica TaxID=455432 RepID=A0A164JZI8_9NOCA|nr:hydroxyisourate hydrolase [Nocardia terpenica]KZM70882.1 hydroxyisourate hydrolase [Nocardia terpenica]NQE89818.1 hydroxyisourate hydrolase [Nocardia terpenica]